VALREGPQTLKAHFHKMAVVTMYNTILSNHAPSTDMHTLSLHDALPISCDGLAHEAHEEIRLAEAARLGHHRQRLAARRAQPAERQPRPWRALEIQALGAERVIERDERLAAGDEHDVDGPGIEPRARLRGEVG